MELQRDKELLGEIIRATVEERLRWLPTARLNEYTSAFNGRWSVVVGSYGEGEYRLEVSDDGGHTVLRLADRDLPMLSVPSVRELFEAVSRKAFHSDKGIDELLRELKRA